MCEKPAKYTRHAPRIDAQTAAVRRCVRVVVALAELLWPVLLMIDMAFPCGLSAGNQKRMQKSARSGAQRFEQRPPTAGLSFSDGVFTLCCGPVSGLTRGAGIGLILQASPSHAFSAQWI
jgi:hypothetical protein